ncbi:Sensor histidine kinase YesM [Paenibacillus sp. UNCCL117]|uniref:sensor histidine kinase n=1 Tax=unclassified Paenibacillus TaxID=185978 RepID=UPI0008812CEE|nr:MULTISPECIES: histidine kinase [unclassified Paenibacillus]SDD07311.1 Sensor histidine kinase YesM [Paenibacillus sp. cl123]SFW31500.1 Sensor histidine kinase YesM [Paenibacillus sp. UNCCL117]
MKAFRRSHLTLFIKMFILLFLSVSVPVTILGAWYFEKSTEQIKHVTSALLTENLEQNRLRIEQFLRQVELHSDSIIGSGKLEVLGSGLEDRLFLSRSLTLTNELKGSYELTILPADEARFASYSMLIQPGRKASGTEWIRKAIELKGRGYWYVENDTFIFARLIRGMQDLRPLAVIQLNIPAAHIKRQIMSPAAYPNVEHFMVNSVNEPILASGQERKYWKQDDVFLASLPFAELPWKLVAAVPEKDLIGPVETIKRFSGMLVLISIALVSVLLALITSSFVSPIKYLVGQMKKAQLGQLIPSDRYGERSDEIGQLARGYNSLIFGMRELLATTRQMEAEKSRTEMQMLIHQINPHFLYNTLDAMKWRANHVRESTIAEMVTSLSNIIRYSINNGEEFTTVEREIEHVKSYLKIESLRNQDTLRVIIHVQPRALNMPILKLTIQPLVENAVRHGMSRLPAGQGKILIRVFIEGEELVCTVEDNGPGFAEEPQLQTIRPHEPGETGGVGLYNVNRRLHIRFGSKYGVALANREQGGCRAMIRHPLM